MDVDKSETTIIHETSDDSEHPQLQLLAAKFQERYAFIQEDVNIRSQNGNLPTIEAPKPEVMAFIAKLKQHPASIISEYAKAKNLPICNYFIYEIAGPQKNYICVMEYDKQQIYGCLKKSKKEAKTSGAMKLVHHLFEAGELTILDKEDKKKHPKAGVEQEDIREAFEEANPAPMVDCPPEYTTIRDEIWKRFEYEGLPDPVFCPDTERILSEAESGALSLLNSHLALTKEKFPDIIVYQAPCIRDGNKYIAGTNYEEMLIIGAISRSKNLAKQNCAAAIIDYLVRTNKFNILRKLKGKAGFEHEDTREEYEGANPAPIVDCPADFTTIRDEIWRKFEDERLPDPVFCPDTERILSEAERDAISLLNTHLALTKEKFPDVIVYQAPCILDGNKYIAGTNYEEKLIIGAISRSKNLAKQNCAAAIIDYLVRTNKLNIPRKLKAKAGFEHEDTREDYEEANPAPIVDCPADFTTIRDEIWRRFEDERLPDPFFSPDTEKIISEAETAPPGLLNAHLASTKEKTPEIIVYRAPCVREGNKYIAGTSYDEKLIIGSISRSKNLAKQNCAAAVIDYLVRTNKFNIPRKLKRKIEFSEALGGGDDSPGAKQTRLEALHLDLDGRTICFLSSGKSPQSILNEYCAKNRIRQAKYDIIQHGFFFKAKCIADGIESVSALPEASKRKAKDSAATKLIDLFVREGRFDTKKGDKSSAMRMEVEDFEVPEFNDLKAQEYTSNFGGESIFDVTQNLVYNAVQEALEAIPEMSCSSEQFAGCVILNSNNDQATLISWATGNGYNSVSNNEGNVLNDCYAEVLCRRGIVLYLLDEIQKHLESLHSIFMLDEGILKIRHEYSFHLYLSHSPNGDASRLEPIPWKFDLVFPVADYPIPPGLGQISIKSDGLNALRIHSDPMGYPPIDCSVSSSEKILKWNVCGIQGAILSKFIKPVHFNSISIGNNYDSRHVSRALYCRAKVDGQLHYPYYLNKPILVSASEKKIVFPESNEPKIFSANWNYVDETIEIINSTTGTVANEPSRLCRLSIYSRFQQVMQSHLPQYVSMPYTKLKMEAHLYVQSAITLKQSLQRNGFGVWPCKGPSASMSGIRARAPDFASDDIYS